MTDKHPRPAADRAERFISHEGDFTLDLPAGRPPLTKGRRATRGGRNPRPQVLRLAEARRQRGLTQEAVAQQLGISQSRVSALETRSDPRVSSIASYLSALGADAIEIRAHVPAQGDEAETEVVVRIGDQR